MTRSSRDDNQENTKILRIRKRKRVRGSYDVPGRTFMNERVGVLGMMLRGFESFFFFLMMNDERLGKIFLIFLKPNSLSRRETMDVRRICLKSEVMINKGFRRLFRLVHDTRTYVRRMISLTYIYMCKHVDISTITISLLLLSIYFVVVLE